MTNSAPFEDVLFPGPGGLDHLINRAIRFGKKPMAESMDKIVNNLSFPKGKQFPVITAWRDKPSIIVHRR
jgi:hypothetical protein